MNKKNIRLFIGVLMLITIIPLGASAKHTKKITMNYDQLWSGCIRYLRIERGFEILDKDKDAGYIIFTFKYPKGKKTSRATLELIVLGEEASGKKNVNVQANIESAPEYMEIHLVDQLIEKLKKEYDTK